LTAEENRGRQYQFGNFHIDTAERLLARDNEALPLPPKAFDLLVLLLDNAGRLLTKQHIMEALWPETFVEEANLANLISLLRKLLGDTAANPAYIETVPKRGYRFIAHLSPVPKPPEQPGEPRTQGVIRFIAFPFRTSTTEASDFLEYSLPEAIGATLAELNAFTVRSTQMGSRFDPVHWDPRAVAEEADVDVILSGAIVREDGQIRATTQLMDAPSATLLWSKIWDVPASELYRLHRGIVQLIIRSLIRRTRQSANLLVDTPDAAAAYELYLRANELTLKRSPENMAHARDLYVACTQLDPGYAPAWARLGRCYRWLEKFGGPDAATTRLTEAAFARAFELNPHLAIAHTLYTPILCDSGHAVTAMVRLIGMLERNGNNAELFAALVQACRYCGQLDASVAAHERAFRLDRNLPTSVAHTYFALGDYDKALYWYDTKTGMYLDILALAMMGRLDDASALLWTRRERLSMQPALMQSLRYYLEGDAAAGLAAFGLAAHDSGPDPEVRFYMARQAAKFGDVSLALKFLTLSAASGYGSSLALMHDPWLENLRGTPEFDQVLRTTRAREHEAHDALVAAGGERFLDPAPHLP
jgi:DNA-binding winged helix-turn-helix (wHTH) protein/tetratricopeptide (TPR) repeat protein